MEQTKAQSEKTLFTIIRALYAIEELEQSDVDVMLTAYMIEHNLVDEDQMVRKVTSTETALDLFLNDLNSMAIHREGVAEESYRKYMQGYDDAFYFWHGYALTSKTQF